MVVKFFLHYSLQCRMFSSIPRLGQLDAHMCPSPAVIIIKNPLPFNLNSGFAQQLKTLEILLISKITKPSTSNKELLLQDLTIFVYR